MMMPEGPIAYDDADSVEVIRDEPAIAATPIFESGATAPVDGMGCHAGASTMMEAARAAGKSDILDQYARDYPQGPHDQPQSMCPAFGRCAWGCG